ncbi:RHS repeat-associated core domain-containing protein [Ruegeria sp. SCPT10]|uniref:RHS repeat-associated core domain-containing protein n=1 Tax=Ruegeria sp. SCP10 TaxID=3141377 RepID=UPI00333BDCBD
MIPKILRAAISAVVLCFPVTSMAQQTCETQGVHMWRTGNYTYEESAAIACQLPEHLKQKGYVELGYRINKQLFGEELRCYHKRPILNGWKLGLGDRQLACVTALDGTKQPEKYCDVGPSCVCQTGDCGTCSADGNPGTNTAGNPISLAHGIKTEVATDWVSIKDSRFSLVRHYNSAGGRFYNPYDFGLGWEGNWSYMHVQPYSWQFEQRLFSPGNVITTFGNANNDIGATLLEGSALELTYIGATDHEANYSWIDTPTPENDNFRLSDGSGREITLSAYGLPWNMNVSRSKYRYASKIEWQDGYRITFDRNSDGRIQSATDNRGQRADFTWVEIDHDPFGLDGVVWNFVPETLWYVSKIDVDPSYDGQNFDPSVAVNYTYSDAGRLSGLELSSAVVTDLQSNAELQSTSYSYDPILNGHRELPLLAGISDGRVDANGDPFEFASFEYSASEADAQTGAPRAVFTGHAEDSLDFSVVVEAASTASAGGVKVTNPLGKETNYSYEWVGGVKRPVAIDGVATQHCLATTKSLGYAPNAGAPEGFVYERVERNGSRTTYERDARGLVLTKTEDADGLAPRVTSYTWHSELQLPLTRTTNEMSESFAYDADGQVVSYTQTDVLSGSPSNGQTRNWTYNYTTLGSGLKVLQSIDGPGLVSNSIDDVTSYTYNSSGVVTAITDANGLTTTFSDFDANDLPQRIEEPNGVVWVMAYDALGRVVQTTENAGSSKEYTNSYAYDLVGQVTSFTNSSGHTWTFEYDRARRLTAVLDQAGQKMVYHYDAADNVTKTEYLSAAGATQFEETYLYDELSRMRGLSGPHGQLATFTHDVEDNLASATDALSNSTTYGFDSLNRLVSMLDQQNGAQTDMSHNNADLVTQYTDPRNLVTNFVYNGFGDVVREESGDRGTIIYTYDERGLVTSMTDGRGTVSNYTYDDGGRITARGFPTASIENQLFVYDGTANGSEGQGQIATITDQAGTISRTYADGGRLTLDRRQLQTATYDTSYGYNAAGLLDHLTTPSGLRISYSYDGQERVTDVTIQRQVIDPQTGVFPPAQTVLSGAAYAPFGPVTGFTYGDNATHVRTYDTSYRLNALKDDLGAIALRDLTHSWTTRDNLGAVTDNLNSLNSETFQYSAQQRLAEAIGPYGEIDFTYDKVGNRTSKVEDNNGTLTTASYNYPATSNRLADITVGLSTRTFTHDMAGNVTYDNRSSGGYGYAYNAANRMSEFSINGVVQAEYVYNALGQQVIRRLTQEGKTLHVIHDSDGNRLAEYEYDPVSGGSTLLREYIWFNGEAVGVVENDTLYFVRTDQIGRPAFATDANGLKVWEASFLPFGGVHTSTGANSDLRFPGQWFQSEAGLHQNWMRDYDPTTGRYIQADPLGLVDGPSVYGYALQNPGRYTDPRGEQVVIPLPPPIAPSTPSGNHHTQAGQFMLDILTELLDRTTNTNPAEPIPFSIARMLCDPFEDGWWPNVHQDENGAEHTSGARPSTKAKHEKGRARKNRDRGNEKGDSSRKPPRKRPPNYKGPWPPR